MPRIFPKASLASSSLYYGVVNIEFISYMSFSISTIIWWHALRSVLAVVYNSLSSARFMPNWTVVNTVFYSSTIVSAAGSWSKSLTSSRVTPTIYCIKLGVIKLSSGTSSSSKSVILCLLAISSSLSFILLAESES